MTASPNHTPSAALPEVNPLCVDPSVIASLRSSTRAAYITGQANLEVPDHTGLSEGWHLGPYLWTQGGWPRNGIEAPDTIPYLGDDGIEDRTADIRLHLRLPNFHGPAWMTSHARGYADIVLHDALANREIQRCLDRDIDAKQTMTKIHALLQAARGNLPTNALGRLDAWLTSPTSAIL